MKKKLLISIAMITLMFSMANAQTISTADTNETNKLKVDKTVREAQAYMKGEEPTKNKSFTITDEVNSKKLVKSKAPSDDYLLFSDDFSVSSNWIISNEAGNSLNWEIGTTGPSGSYAIDPIKSSTASNGFAIIDSDLNGSGFKANLTTANSINCSDAEIVYLVFETWLRVFQGESFYVKVSTDNSTWTSYRLFQNLAANQYCGSDPSNGDNPTIIALDISEVAAEESTVWVRFYYEGGDAYSWMIDDVKLYSTEYIMPPAVTTEVYNTGFWSLLEEGTVYSSFEEPFFYYSLVQNAKSHSWSFDSSATDITELGSTETEKLIGLFYNKSGEHTGTLNVTGLDDGSFIHESTVNMVSPLTLDNELVTNFCPTDKYSIYNLNNVNYSFVYGVNTFYRAIAEKFVLPADVTVTMDAIYFYTATYNLAAANRSKNLIITIYDEDEDGLPGEIINSYNAPFSTAFGTTAISTLTSRGLNLPAPLEITGSFFIAFDFTNAGTLAASNYVGIIGSQDRENIGYNTAYCFYQNEWTELGEILLDGTCAIFPRLTSATSMELQSTTPIDEAIDVELDATVSATFDRDIMGSLEGIKINDETVTASAKNNILTLAHEDFEYETEYTVVIPAEAIEGLEEDVTWSFTTGTQPVIPPVMQSTSPQNNATGIALNAEISVTFDKDITKGDNFEEISIKNKAGDIVSEVSATISGAKLSVTHANFDYETEYTVTIPANAVNHYNEVITWTFTTEAAPAVQSTTPVDKATGVAINAAVTVSFDKNVELSVNTDDVTIKDKDGNAVAGISVSASGKTVTIAHNDFDYETEYTVTVPAGVIPSYTEAISWTFTTDDEPAPVVKGTTPTEHATLVPIDVAVTITFDKEVTLGANKGEVTIKDKDGNEVAGVEVTVSGAVVTISHNTFAYETVYTVTVPVGAIERYNEALSWSFTTIEDPDAIGIVSVEKTSIYPNPTKGKVTITAPENSIVKITSIAGTIIESYQSAGVTSLDLSLPNGVYFILVEKDGKTNTQKLIIQK